MPPPGSHPREDIHFQWCSGNYSFKGYPETERLSLSSPGEGIGRGQGTLPVTKAKKRLFL